MRTPMQDEREPDTAGRVRPMAEVRHLAARTAMSIQNTENAVNGMPNITAEPNRSV